MRSSALLAFLVLTTAGWSQDPLKRKLVEPPITRAEVQALIAKQNAEYPAETPPDWWSRIINVALAIVGTGQLYFIFKTLKVTEKAADAAVKSANAAERAVNDSQGAAEQTLALTKQAADAATLNAQIAKTALEVTERAVIDVESVTISTRGASDTQMITIDFQNRGRTIALLEANLLRYGVFDSLPSPVDRLGEEAKTATMGSGLGMQFTDPITLSALEFEDVEEGRKNLFVWGFIRYRDVFGTRHETAFARVWRPTHKWFVLAEDPNYNYTT